MAYLLAIITFATHELWQPLSLLWDNSARAASEIFYVARGVEGAVLFLTVLWYCERKPKEIEVLVLMLTCVYGAVQEALTSICGAAYVSLFGVGKHENNNSGKGLCDFSSGWEGTVWATVFFGFALVLIIRLLRKKNATRRGPFDA